ncbi:MAG TPA: thioredoxin domain-containing protein [Pseudonocardiaceae bacterium]|nr:thioredoxin domain-containing protein [Pseudonocardiaceae bacterium]
MSRSQRVKRTPAKAKQAGSRAVSAARGSGSGHAGMYAGIAVIVVLAVVVAIGVLASRSQHSAQPIPPVRVAAGYPVDVREGVVVAGAPGASITVDAYEDFLCPVCGEFESQHATKIQQALTAGRIIVRYHMLNLLQERSNPPGYSLQAASVGLCAAKAGVFPSYHASLYAKQPAEGAAGYTVDQLVTLGGALGAKGGFESCARSGTYDAAVKAQLSAAGSDPALVRQGPSGPSFGTPTVLVNGKVIEVLSPAGSAQFDQLIS